MKQERRRRDKTFRAKHDKWTTEVVVRRRQREAKDGLMTRPPDTSRLKTRTERHRGKHNTARSLYLGECTPTHNTLVKTNDTTIYSNYQLCKFRGEKGRCGLVLNWRIITKTWTQKGRRLFANLAWTALKILTNRYQATPSHIHRHTLSRHCL